MMKSVVNGADHVPSADAETKDPAEADTFF